MNPKLYVAVSGIFIGLLLITTIGAWINDLMSTTGF